MEPEVIYLRRYYWELPVYVCLLLLSFVLYKSWSLSKRYSSLPTYNASLATILRLLSVGGAPFLCILFQVLCGISQIFTDQGLYLLWIMWSPHVFIHKAEIIKELINHPAAIGKPKEYQALQEVLGSGLLTSTEQVWHSHRKIISPVFRLEMIKGYLPVFNEQAMNLVKSWKDLVKEPWFDVTSRMDTCTMGIILDSILGIESSAEVKQKIIDTYIKAVKGLSHLTIYRMIRPWTNNRLWYTFSSTAIPHHKTINEVQVTSEKVISEKSIRISSQMKMGRALSGKLKTKQTLVDLLLQHNLRSPDFTVQDIKDHVSSFISAGFNTSAVSLRWALFLIGLHPEVQDTIFEELESIFRNTSQKVLTYEDLCDMKYLDCVIKETLRLYPPIPIFGRELHEDVTVGDYKIPNGTVLVYNLYMLHRDCEHFSDPEKFYPERFFPENSQHRHPFAFLPFSAGGRNCIAHKFAMMEMKVILGHILWNYHITSLDKRDKINTSWEIDLRNLSPIRLTLTSREH